MEGRDMSFSAEFERRRGLARQHVTKMDQTDGFRDRDMKTILFALQCGLNRPETNAQFDALVMLEDVCGVAST